MNLKIPKISLKILYFLILLNLTIFSFRYFVSEIVFQKDKDNYHLDPDTIHHETRNFF